MFPVLCLAVLFFGVSARPEQHKLISRAADWENVVKNVLKGAEDFFEMLTCAIEAFECADMVKPEINATASSQCKQANLLVSCIANACPQSFEEMVCKKATEGHRSRRCGSPHTMSCRSQLQLDNRSFRAPVPVDAAQAQVAPAAVQTPMEAKSARASGL